MWLLLLADLRRRWLELALGATAVALVVAALVAHRALTSSAERAVHDLAHRLGGNMLVVPARTDLAAFYAQRFGPEPIPDSAVTTLRASPIAQDLRSIEARLHGEARVNGAEVVVVGQDLAWPALGDVQPAVLGREASRAAGLRPGDHFQLGGVAFRVLQVPDAMPDGLDRAVFMPLAAAQRALGRPGELSSLRLGGCWCRLDPAALGGQVERLLPGTRAITVAATLKAQKGSVATMQRYSGVLTIAGVAAVAAVSATLIAASVRRRSRELGLLIGIGAPPARVAALFVVQAVLVGLAGGLLGWAAAFPLTHFAGEQLLRAPLPAPDGHLLPTLAVAAAVCGLAAALPAARAARLDPAAVLRED